MATDDRDMPAGAAEGGRDDMPAGPPAQHADNGRLDSGSKRPGSSGAAQEAVPPAVGPAGSGPGPDNDASLSAAAGEHPTAAGEQPAVAGEQPAAARKQPAAREQPAAGEQPAAQAGERQDDDFEPYLPPAAQSVLLGSPAGSAALPAGGG